MSEDPKSSPEENDHDRSQDPMDEDKSASEDEQNFNDQKETVSKEPIDREKVRTIRLSWLIFSMTIKLWTLKYSLFALIRWTY